MTEASLLESKIIAGKNAKLEAVLAHQGLKTLEVFFFFNHVRKCLANIKKVYAILSASLWGNKVVGEVEKVHLFLFFFLGNHLLLLLLTIPRQLLSSTIASHSSSPFSTVRPAIPPVHSPVPTSCPHFPSL